MIARLLLLFLLAVGPAAADEVKIVYLGIENDLFYEPQPTYTGLSLRDRERPLAGAETAIRETRILGRALGLSFALDVKLVEAEAVAETLEQIESESPIGAILDLPAEILDTLPPGGAIPRLDIRTRDNRLRQENCRADLLHVQPSEAMLADALAQVLRSRGWERVLLLVGPSSGDARMAETARRAIAKFGLRLIDERAFDLTNDPRRRDRANIPLLTAGVRHDVVWLIDEEGEFGRYVPYQTQDSRLVVGSEGLTSTAWHWTWERHGAPQLNQRFRRLSDRNMSDLDWAAWAAVRSLVEAVQRAGSNDPASVARLLTDEELSLDLYKGAPGSFRPWNGQLRQPVLLATHNAVIERAPLEGFEHESDTLDTLGIDAPESDCRNDVPAQLTR